MAACVCTVDTQATYQKLRPWEKLTLPFPAAIIITSQLGVRVCVLPHYAGMLIGLICVDPV